MLIRLLLVSIGAAQIAAVAAEQDWLPQWLEPVIGLTIQQAYDDNIYNQDHGPLAKYDSWITSVQPKLGTRFKTASLNLRLSYEPDYSFFHSADKESYLRHIFVTRLNGQYGNLTFAAGATLAYTEGTVDEVIWPFGTPPVLVATEIRDRRRNFKHDWDLNIRWDADKIFARLVGEAHFWDFKARQRLGIPGYHNHVDRSISEIGPDVGYKPDWPVEFYVGYRGGAEGQSHYPGSNLLYDNVFHRVLAGISGKPIKWLTFNGEVGPTFHFFDKDTIHPGQDDERTLLYFKLSATADLGKGVKLQAGGRQLLWPSSAGRTAYQNIKWWGSVSVLIMDGLSTSAGFTVAEYDFLPPVNLRDRTYSPSVELSWRINRHLSTGAQYSFTWADALARDQTAREWEKHQFMLNVSYSY